MINKEMLETAINSRTIKGRSVHTLDFLDTGSGPVDVYMRAYTIGEAHKYDKRFIEGDISSFVELFVEKAEDIDGNALFEKGMEAVLLTLPSACLKTIGDIIGVARVKDSSIKESEKNSERTSPDEP